MITALLVDNDLVMRQLLRGVLERYGDIIVIRESDSGEDAIAQVKRLDPTAVIMDFNFANDERSCGNHFNKASTAGDNHRRLKAGVSGNVEYAMIDAGAAALLNKGELMNVLHPIIVQEVTAQKKSALASATVSH
jgi:DNA-binding NarL/FixJ family response regulator